MDVSFNLSTLPYNQAGHMGASELSTENTFEWYMYFFLLSCKGKQLIISDFAENSIDMILNSQPPQNKIKRKWLEKNNIKTYK